MKSLSQIYEEELAGNVVRATEIVPASSPAILAAIAEVKRDWHAWVVIEMALPLVCIFMVMFKVMLIGETAWEVLGRGDLLLFTAFLFLVLVLEQSELLELSHDFRIESRRPSTPFIHRVWIHQLFAIFCLLLYIVNADDVFRSQRQSSTNPAESFAMSRIDTSLMWWGVLGIFAASFAAYVSISYKRRLWRILTELGQREANQ